jgi:hypothetical protein
VCIGWGSGYSSTWGWNVLVGYAAGSGTTTGRYNVMLGPATGQANVTGDGNIFLGFGAGNSLNSSYNICIGQTAGVSITSGDYNTLLGYNANVSSGTLTNATAIGNGALVNANNKVRIGNASVTVIEGQVAFTNPSDFRLKKNINSLTSGLDFIMKLKPVEYQMKQGDDKINFGFIAQDVEKIIGTNNSILTIGGDADRTLGLRYTDFIAPLVKALQEQQKQIEDLKVQNKEIASLKAELEAIKALLKK